MRDLLTVLAGLVILVLVAALAVPPFIDWRGQRAYVDAILSLPAFQEWRSAALREEWIVEADEVDEGAIEIYRKAA